MDTPEACIGKTRTGRRKGPFKVDYEKVKRWLFASSGSETIARTMVHVLKFYFWAHAVNTSAVQDGAHVGRIVAQTVAQIIAQIIARSRNSINYIRICVKGRTIASHGSTMFATGLK